MPYTTLFRSRPARSISSARLRATTAGSSPSAARALPRLNSSNGACELPAPQRNVVKACTLAGASQFASSMKPAAPEPLSRVLEPLSCLRERGWGEGVSGCDDVMAWERQNPKPPPHRSEEHTSELQSLLRK